MSSLTISRGRAVTAAALLLGGALIAGASLLGPDATAHTSTADTSIATTSTATTSSGGITVTGTARVAGTPDTLRLDLSVTGRAGSVADALSRANASASKVQASLTRNGVASKDLQTSTVQVQPEYAYPAGGRPTVTGYTAVEGITAALRDLGRAGAVISAVTAAGGDAVQVNGVSLDVESTSVLAAKARAAAVSDARTRADQLAKAASRQVGAVTSMTENVSTPGPMPYTAAARTADSSAVPIQPGSQDVAVSVTVTYALE
jgi:uncharacterized protein